MEVSLKTDLEDKLKNGNKLEVFNKLIFTMMNGDYPDLTKWNEYKTELLEILETQDIAFWDMIALRRLNLAMYQVLAIYIFVKMVFI